MDLTGLTTEETNFFTDQGYLIFPEFLTPDHAESVIQDISRLRELRAGGYAERNTDANGSALVVTLPHLGGLTSYPPMMANIQSLMGEARFALHHQHAEQHQPGTPGSNWHHDYEQFPQIDREQVMVHCFYYPNGLNGEIGDLILLPRSHTAVMHRNAFSDKFYSEGLPGSLTVNDLPLGSAVVVHSALMHGRRGKPGGSGYCRYFTDVSYCQAGEKMWPSYGFPFPKLWLREQIRERALKAGHGRDGQYDFIFDTQIFYDPETATEIQRQCMQQMIGSNQQRKGVRESVNPRAS